MRFDLDHHGITVTVSYWESSTMEYGAADCDFEILTFELTDRDEWEAWRPGIEPTSDALRRVVLDARDELMREAAEKWACRTDPPREIRMFEGLSARIDR